MKTKSKRKPRPSRCSRYHFPELTHEQIETILAVASKAPPVALPPVLAAPAQPGPIMWHFQHTHPELPNTIMNLCTVAPTIAEARGKAYLLAENFTQNVIGFLKANKPPQLPGAAA